MKKLAKMFSAALVLLLVVGLLPGMSLTAYAASHNITINNAQHGTVTASVNGSAVTSADEGTIVTLTANPEDGYRLKSISGTYKDYSSERLSSGGYPWKSYPFTIDGTSFTATIADGNMGNDLWYLRNNKGVTINAKGNSSITKVVFSVNRKGIRAPSPSPTGGTMTETGNTITINCGTGQSSVKLTGSGTDNASNIGLNPYVVIYGNSVVDTPLSIAASGVSNVCTFTMPAVVEGNVTITAEFEEAPKYSVTITPGSNMTKTTDSGAASQTGLSGAMTPVVYTANDGYCFAEFADITNNGITATRTNDTTVTVSGTPTANASITIPDAVHTHNFNYSVDGATITATCINAGCSLTDSKVTLTLNANDSTYSGSAYTGASLDSAAWTAAGLTVPTINYNGSATAPTNAGDYTANVTAGGVTAAKDFTIVKANPTATAPSLTATYGQTLGDLTLTNPSENTEGTWAWAVDESTSVGSVGTHTFKANFTPTDTTNYNSKTNVDVTVTVGKAANPATVTGTAAVMKGGNTVDLADNVTLNGATGEVTYEISGEANGCSLNGSVLTSGDNTGELTVNVTVAEDGNYTALTATPITVTVTDKQTQTITADNITATYGDTGKSVEATLTKGNGTLSYAVKEGDAVNVDAETGALTIAKAGTAVVTVTASETKGYAKAEKDITVTIERKPITVKAKDQSIYTGETVPSLTSPVLDTHYTVTGLVGSDALTTPPTLS